MAGSRSKAWRVVGTVLLIVVGTFGATFGFLLYRDYSISPQRWPRVESTSSKWKALAAEKRFVLVNDLIERRRLHRLTKEQVTQVLGKPDSEWSGQWSGNVTYHMSYQVKHDPTLYFLHIRFDGEGRVEEYHVRYD